MATDKPISLETCRPRFATERDLSRESYGAAVGAAARALGMPLMPWQQLVADVGLEVDADGKPAYRQVIFSTPRQSGKSTLIEAWSVQRAVGWAQMLDAPQRIVYTAQTGADAAKKMVTDYFRDFERHKNQLGIARTTRANGKESVYWKNGSQFYCLSSAEDAGHGQTIDLAFIDELFADSDDRRMQALIPATLTKRFAQILVCSTMGTPKSVAWNAKVAMGRAAAASGKRSGVAYFEWSADPAADPADPVTWASCMPAMGRTQDVDVIRSSFDSMVAEKKLGEFKRAFLNISTASEEQVIPSVSWDIVRRADLEVVPVVFAVDCNPERSSAGIVAVGAGPTVEVVDYRQGMGWFVDRVVELALPRGVPVAVASSGPAGAFVPELERAGLRVVQVPARDEARAAGRFYDLVVSNAMEVRSDPDLDAAVGAAVKRATGDSWAWARKSSTKDICLLVAASIGAFVVDDSSVLSTESDFYVI